MHRTRSITNLKRGHITRCILRGIAAKYETESLFRSGLPSVVDQSRIKWKSSMIPRRTDIENRQVGHGSGDPIGPWVLGKMPSVNNARIDSDVLRPGPENSF